jgi:hypothetical protein
MKLDYVQFRRVLKIEFPYFIHKIQVDVRLGRPIIKSQPVKIFQEKMHSSSFDDNFDIREFSAILRKELNCTIFIKIIMQIDLLSQSCNETVNVDH